MTVLIPFLQECFLPFLHLFTFCSLSLKIQLNLTVPLPALLPGNFSNLRPTSYKVWDLLFPYLSLVFETQFYEVLCFNSTSLYMCLWGHGHFLTPVFRIGSSYKEGYEIPNLIKQLLLGIIRKIQVQRINVKGQNKSK